MILKVKYKVVVYSFAPSSTSWLDLYILNHLNFLGTLEHYTPALILEANKVINHDAILVHTAGTHSTAVWTCASCLPMYKVGLEPTAISLSVSYFTNSAIGYHKAYLTTISINKHHLHFFWKVMFYLYSLILVYLALQYHISAQFSMTDFVTMAKNTFFNVHIL